MEKVSWIQNGSNFKRVEGNVSNVESIPIGIYNVKFEPFGGWSLEKTGEKFEFNYKVYGLQTHFINHVLKTFEHTKGNLGILLNGTKGTGKTVSAKILANKFNLPIIVVKSFGDNNTALIEYLSSFNFDCVFFLDEFEKNWNSEDSSILQIMDGVYSSNYRRVFLLTTNETHINENLISRPSRLRYVKEFGNLEKEVVEEYLKDNLKNPECIDCIVDFVDTLQISTIDILKTIVEDINIHGFDTFIENKDIFNIKTAKYYYYTIKTAFDGSDLQDRNYTIDSFVKDVKIYETVKTPYRYMYDNDEEYNKACENYAKNRCKVSMDRMDVDTNKSYKSFKVGYHFGLYVEEIVIATDIERRVIVTEDPSDNTVTFYYITNPNTKPSLFTSDSAYTNAYNL